MCGAYAAHMSEIDKLDVHSLIFGYFDVESDT